MITIDERTVGLAVSAEQSHRVIDVYNDPGKLTSLVRMAVAGSGLGQMDPSAPLKDIIAPGMTVLLKPNWVLHSNQSGKGMDCMVTHPRFIEAVVDEVCKAKPGRIVIADAPIQDCIFDQLVPSDWVDQLRERACPCPLEVVDLRRSVRREGYLNTRVMKDLRDLESFVLFDLATSSLLEDISHPGGLFRNTNYDPRELERTHRPGRHQYLLSREIFDADVVISLPKLKTHRKAGITAALKNLVGVNGDKDFLPHHRLGGTSRGGDCYRGYSPLKSAAEYCLDEANQRINRPGYSSLGYACRVLLKAESLLFGDNQIEGSWHGNDTVWRMVLDLNRLLLYGLADGSLSPVPQRKVYSLTDGLVAGEAFGPLAPEPVHLGAVTFASSSPFAELVHAALMCYDWRKIPLLRHAFDQFPYPLASHGPEEVNIVADGRQLTLDEVSKSFGKRFEPPRGWQGAIELE